jgi:phage shock protein PspC (stress-responsive transcriptional regulator)
MTDIERSFPTGLHRLIFAALFICAGAGLLLYVSLWLFVPSE